MARAIPLSQIVAPERAADGGDSDGEGSVVSSFSYTSSLMSTVPRESLRLKLGVVYIEGSRQRRLKKSSKKKKRRMSKEQMRCKQAPSEDADEKPENSSCNVSCSCASSSLVSRFVDCFVWAFGNVAVEHALEAAEDSMNATTTPLRERKSDDASPVTPEGSPSANLQWIEAHNVLQLHVQSMAEAPAHEVAPPQASSPSPALEQGVLEEQATTCAHEATCAHESLTSTSCATSTSPKVEQAPSAKSHCLLGQISKGDSSQPLQE